LQRIDFRDNIYFKNPKALTIVKAFVKNTNIKNINKLL